MSDCKLCGREVNESFFNFRLADGHWYHEECTAKLAKEKKLPRERTVRCAECEGIKKCNGDWFKGHDRLGQERWYHGQCLHSKLNRDVGLTPDGKELTEGQKRKTNRWGRE